MKFEVIIKYRNRSYQLNVEVIKTTPTLEQILVTGYWGRSIKLQNNRPFFVNRQLKHGRWDWELLAGSVKESGIIIKVAEAIIRKAKLRVILKLPINSSRWGRGKLKGNKVKGTSNFLFYQK